MAALARNQPLSPLPYWIAGGTDGVKRIGSNAGGGEGKKEAGLKEDAAKWDAGHPEGK